MGFVKFGFNKEIKSIKKKHSFWSNSFNYIHLIAFFYLLIEMILLDFEFVSVNTKTSKN